MMFLIEQMWPCLLLAALIGAILGWLLRKCKRRIDTQPEGDLPEDDREVIALKKHRVVSDVEATGNTDVSATIAGIAGTAGVAYVADKMRTDTTVQRLSGDFDSQKQLLDDEVMQLRLKLSAAELEAKTSVMKLSAMDSDYTAKLKSAEETFYNRDERLQSLQSELETTQSALADEKVKFSNLETSYESKLEKISHISDDSEVKLQGLKDKLSKAESNISAHDGELDNLKEELNKVQSAHTQLAQEKDALESNYTKMQTDYNDKLKEVSNTSYDSEQELKALQTELDEVKQEKETFKKRYETENEGAKDTEKELQSLRDKLAHAQQEATSHEETQAKLKVELEQAKDAEAEVLKLKSLLEEERTESEKKILSMQSEFGVKLDAEKAVSKDAEKTLQIFQSKFEDSEREALTLKADLTQAKSSETEVLKFKSLFEEEQTESEKKLSMMKSDYDFKFNALNAISKDTDNELQVLKDKLADVEKENTTHINEIESLRGDAAQVLTLKGEIETLKAVQNNEKLAYDKKLLIAQKEYELKLQQSSDNVKDYDKELQGLRDSLASVKAQKENQDKEIETLKGQLTAFDDKSKDSATEIQTLKAKFEDANFAGTELKDISTELDNAKLEISSSSIKLKEIESDYTFKLKEANSESEELRGEIRILQDKLKQVKPPMLDVEDEIEVGVKPLASMKAVASGDMIKPAVIEKPKTPDNLENIRGVGRKVSKTLNTLGIYRYSQIASWTDEEVSWVDEHLTFSGRIKDEDWISQAKALMKLDEGAYIKGSSLGTSLPSVTTPEMENTDAKDTQKSEIDANRKIDAKSTSKKISKGSSTTESISTKKPTFLKKPEGKADNLQLIKGVGGKLNGVLNDIGVYHFSQIASWNDEEVAWVDEHLSFPGRIEREDWILQAKALMSGEETEFSSRVKAGEVVGSTHHEDDHEDATMLRPQFLIQARETGADRLEDIKGIDVKMAKKLHDMGVFHYDQIANWGVKESAWMNQKLSLSSKIEKDDWIAQAKVLSAGESAQVETTRPEFLNTPDGKADNLQLIKGVGTKLNDVLNDLGVFHFSQIASWNEEEVAWVNEHLSFTGRIQREDWIAQAKDLMSGKETEFSKRVKKGDVPTSSNKGDDSLKRIKQSKRLKKK